MSEINLKRFKSDDVTEVLDFVCKTFIFLTLSAAPAFVRLFRMLST